MKKKRKRPANLCGAKLVDGSGRTCRHPAGWGTGTGRGRCKKHGGNTPTHVKKAKREQLKEAVEIFGLPHEIDATDALIDEVKRTAGIVRCLDLIIQSKTAKQLLDDPNLVLWHRQERRHGLMVSRVAIAAGVEERKIRIKEQEAAIFAAALHGMFEDLGVADHPKLGKIVRRHLTVLQGGAA